MMKAKALIGLALASFVGACSTAYINGDYWARPGLTQAQLDADGTSCAASVKSAAQDEEANFSNREKGEMLQACLEAKGYELRHFTDEQQFVMQDLDPEARANYLKALQADAKFSRSIIFIPAAPENQLP